MRGRRGSQGLQWRQEASEISHPGDKINDNVGNYYYYCCWMDVSMCPGQKDDDDECVCQTGDRFADKWYKFER